MSYSDFYQDGILLGVFFEASNNETDHLYVSFDGVNFKQLSVPYIDTQSNSEPSNRVAFRDPGFAYVNGKYWIVNGDVDKSDSNAYKYQPKYGFSTDLVNWSPVVNGDVDSVNNPISFEGNYPYNADATYGNRQFDAWGPDLFVDGSNIYMLLSAGYWGVEHGQTPDRDVMKQYIIEVDSLFVDNNGVAHASYGTPMKINLPVLNAIYDERNEKRGGSSTVYREDRIDSFLYKENGWYYFTVKRFGTVIELWRINNLNNVSNENAWELINSDFIEGYEGSCILKFKNKYMTFCDKLELSPIECPDYKQGIAVAVADNLNADTKWKYPTKIVFTEPGHTGTDEIIRRHGTVIHITDQNQINMILALYESIYGTAVNTTYNFDMNNGWFRSNGKRYYKENGVCVAYAERFIDGHYRWFDADCSLARNKFVYIPNLDKWVHYGYGGEMHKGEELIGNREFNYVDLSTEYYWYYFDEITGEIAKSKFVYLPSGDKWVYYNSDGHMVYGEQCINSNWYYFQPVTGAMAKGWITLPDGRRCHYDEITGIRDQVI